MHRISKRLESKFMTSFIQHCRNHSKKYFSIEHPDFTKLRKRADFIQVLMYLESLGYIAIKWESESIYMVVLTNDGLSYIEKAWSERVEVWWTRGLAIAALVISLVALALEFHDRGWIRSARIFQEQSETEISVSPLPTVLPQTNLP